MDATVRLEKAGIPAVCIAAPPFREEVESHSRMHGIPYLTHVVVEYGQEVLPLIPPAVEKAFPLIVKGLTTPAEELMKIIPGEMK